MEVRKRSGTKPSLRFRLLLFACAIGLLAMVFIVLFFTNLRPTIMALAEARIQSIGARAMNDAIFVSLEDSEAYTQLLEVYENDDHVYMLQANTRNMNLLAADCSRAAQNQIAALGEQGLSVPLGTLTGISLLSGRGPNLHFTFTPVGSVQSEFSSEFVSTGINQSLYRVNLYLTASVKLVMSGISETIVIRAESAIAECILVGDVPQVYTYVPDTDSMLNVIPTELP